MSAAGYPIGVATWKVEVQNNHLGLRGEFDISLGRKMHSFGFCPNEGGGTQWVNGVRTYNGILAKE